jgi:hypothetical protein
MKHLEVSGAVQHIYKSLGCEGLTVLHNKQATKLNTKFKEHQIMDSSYWLHVRFRNVKTFFQTKERKRD